MSTKLPAALPMSPAQLRRLQMLWHRWTQNLRLGKAADRTLRHYYVELFTGGHARETGQLTRRDAALVIARLERLADATETKLHQAAGTAGRHGYPEWRRVAPNAAAWRVFWASAKELGMNCARLERFIHARYSSLGLHGLSDLRTMADLNRVLWGLKALLRRGPATQRGGVPARRKAA